MERFEPSVDASERSEVLAALSAVNALLADELSRKSVLAVRVERPRPVALNTTPVMLNVDLPVSLNTSFNVSPFSRLTPLKEESCELVSATGAAAVRPAKAAPLVVTAVPPIVPIVEDAASFVVVMLILPVDESIVACRLFAASAVFKPFRSWI